LGIAVFASIRNLWREARADVVYKEALDLLARHDRSSPNELESAFDGAKRDLELELGEIAGWSPEPK
jgi:hypothetical protein